MATQIVIKNSSVTGNVPDPTDLQRGELAINLADQRLFSKNTSDEVFEIGADAQVPNGDDPPVDGNQPGDLFYDTSTDSLLYWNGTDWVPIAGSEALALNDLSDVTAGSPTNGQVLSYDLGTTSWIPVSPASLAVDVDLGYTAAADGGTVTNNAGDDAALPLADGSNAGLMAPADFTKLDGIEAGAQVNPDLGTYLQSGDNVSELANDAGYLASGDNVSELTNDAGYITSGDVPALPIEGIVPPVITYENADWSPGGRLSVSTRGYAPGNTTSTCQWTRDGVDIPGATSCMAWTQTSTTGKYQLKVTWTDSDTGREGIGMSNVIDVGSTPTPGVPVPTLEQVLTAGNTATLSISTTGLISGGVGVFTGNVTVTGNVTAAGFRIDELTTLPTD